MESRLQPIIRFLTNKTELPSEQASEETNVSVDDLVQSLNLISQEEGLFFDFQQVDFDLEKLSSSFNERESFKLSSKTGETRAEGASKKKGGYRLDDKEKISELRSLGWKMIAQIGRKLITGNFNLTTLSIPISVCLPKSNLEAAADGFYQMPIYFQWAAAEQNPLERFKLVVTGVIASLHRMKLIFKPLNPILGETFEMTYENGVKLYLEQVSHHPPVNSYYMLAPNKEFVFHGNTGASTSAGLNSLKIILNGKRQVKFKDGGCIEFNTLSDYYDNTFYGDTKLQTKGELVFTDKTNYFKATIPFGNVSGKPTDYFKGTIKQDTVTVSEVYGTYLGFVEFDGERFWDWSETVKVKEMINKKQLPSSSIYREDRTYLLQGNLDLAQEKKEEIEQRQRADRKLRGKN